MKMNDDPGLGPKKPADARALQLERLQAFADSLCNKRKAAVDARSQSGIEQIWREDRDYYNGLDEDAPDEKWQKPVDPRGPITKESERTKEPVKSTVFVNITQTYVDMAAAAIADMLLPTDDMPFGIEPTPEPDLAAAAKDRMVAMRMPDGTVKRAADIAQAMLDESRESAKKAETKIWDWLTEGQWHAEIRKLIDQSAQIGTSILKGPVPTQVRAKKLEKDQQGKATLTIVEKIEPRSRQIDPDNFYPDPACGENIHNGSYTWEKDSITGKQLRELKAQMDPETGQPYYLGDQIDAVLEEGPSAKFGEDEGQEPRPEGYNPDADRFTIWYFYGYASREDLEAAGCTCDKTAQIPCFVVLVNNRVIKAALQPLDSGSFPYDVLVWQRVAGEWTGRGEARRVRTPQRILNAATRAMMDNAGLAAGPIIVIDQDALEPADAGNWQIHPRKVFLKNAGVEIPGGNVRNALATIEIPMMQEPLSAIINYAIEMADRVATMPIQQQGQQGVTQETAEGRRILQNNASVTKRRLAKLFDDNITEPHITRYYEWLLLWGDDPSMKRDFVIDARGSTALFERDAANLAVAQVGALVNDPEFGISKSKWIIEFFKSNKLDPKRFRMTDEELEEAKKRPPPKAPQVQVAEINADAKLKAAKMDTDRDTVHIKTQRDRENQQQGYLLEKLRIDERLKILEYATKRGISLDRARTDLAKAAMELRVQVQLNKGGKGPEVATPPTEPAGRAPDDEAYQK